MALQPVEPSPAATVLLLRPAAAQFEVLMVHRRQRGFFGGLVVFPGGGVDPVDHGDLAARVVRSGSEDRAHRAAAIRELGEETGILLDSKKAVVAPHERGRAFYETLHENDVALNGDELILVSRWVTPAVAPRRFDTRFYLFGVSEIPSVRLDREELTDHRWIQPGEAVRLYEEGDWPMVSPTVAHIRWLARRRSIEEAMEVASGAEGRTLVEPKQMEDGSIVPLVLPGEPA